HLAIGRALAPLREEGVLILASGNLVHNLPHAFGAVRNGETATPPWAVEFDAELARALEQHDADHLVRAPATPAGPTSHPPTPPWAVESDAEPARAPEQHDADPLVRAPATPAGRTSHPTPDPSLPLLYAAGAASPSEPVDFPITGFDLSSISMRTVRFGAA